MNLRKCPFCGGKAELKVSKVCGADAVRVSCTSCHCFTNLFPVGNTFPFEGLPSRYISLDECMKKAADSWNRRGGRTFEKAV